MQKLHRVGEKLYEIWGAMPNYTATAVLLTT